MKRNLALLTLSSGILLLSGCSVSDWGAEQAGILMNQHEYKEIPWSAFMTEEDRSILNEDPILPLPGVNFQSIDTVSVLRELNSQVEQISPYLNDQETYIKAIENPKEFESEVSSVFNSKEAADPLFHTLKEMYSQKYTYPDRLDLIDLEFVQDGESGFWNAHLEWTAVQDSEDFVIFPIVLTFDEKLEYVDGATNDSYQDKAYSRGLEEEALINETMHQSFMNEWTKFEKKFNAKTDGMDTSHLASLSNGKTPLQTLEMLFSTLSGNTANGSFTSFKLNDSEAEALSYYTFSIPTDNAGKISKVRVVYSRPYNQIESINFID